MARYEIFEQLKQLTSLTKTDKGYAKFIQTGDLSLCDYGRGFIDLSIYSYKYPKDGKFYVRLSFGTIDDGDFGGWANFETKEQAEQLVEDLVHKIFENMVTFPSDIELNKLLLPYGIQVGYE